MSYPAFTSFFAESDRTPARIAVWMALQPPFLSFTLPRPVKISVLRTRAGCSKQTAIDTLHWLEQRGYVVAHGRSTRGTVSLSLAWALPE